MSRRIRHSSTSRSENGMLNSITDALSLVDYLPHLFPARLSHKLLKSQRLVKYLKYAVFVASALVTVNTYAADIGAMVLESCSFGMTIDVKDKLAAALEKWMVDKVIMKTSPSVWRASSGAFSRSIDRRFDERKIQTQACEHEIEVTEISSYWFVHKCTLFRCVINLKKDYFGRNRKSVMLRNIGFTKKPSLDLLQETQKYYTEKYANQMTRIWSVRESSWELLTNRKARRLDTVDLNENDKQSLIKDISYYLSEEGEDNYLNRGSPYRRGYLFHGPPGTGKSSLCMAIAAHFNIVVATISLKDSGLNDSTLLRIMASAPSSSLLLLEDIDSAGIDRETTDEVENTQSSPSRHSRGVDSKRHHKNPTTSAVTLSGLLNALDGAAAPEGCVLIMTTNNPDALDPALTRPGRVDYKVEFRNTDKCLVRNTFRRVTRGLDDQELEKNAEEFASQIPDNVFSPAELHGFLLTRDDDIPKALEELPRWIEETLADRERRKKQEERDKTMAYEEAKKAKEEAEQVKIEEEKKKAREVSGSSGNTVAVVRYVDTATSTLEDVSRGSSSSSSCVSIIELSEVEPVSQ